MNDISDLDALSGVGVELFVSWFILISSSSAVILHLKFEMVNQLNFVDLERDPLNKIATVFCCLNRGFS